MTKESGIRMRLQCEGPDYCKIDFYIGYTYVITVNGHDEKRKTKQKFIQTFLSKLFFFSTRIYLFM